MPHGDILSNPVATRVSRLLLACLLVFCTSAMALEDPPKPKSKVPTKPARAPRRVAGAHIVISHVGAEQQFPGVTRSKEEARKLAEEVVTKVRRPDVKGEDAVKELSDDPKAAGNNGKLGIFQKGQLRGPYQAIGDALFGMEIGQVSDAVESPVGFHVLCRVPIVEYSASHILIQ